MKLATAILGAAAATLAIIAAPAMAQDAAQSCAPGDDAALSGWQGVWLPEGLHTSMTGRDISRGSKFVGFDAPWNEAGWKRVRAGLELFGTGEFRVIGFAFPSMLDTAGELSFYVGHNQTVILNVYRDVVVVHTDGREQIPEEEAFTSTWGQSVGCWDGDTLNIETRYVHFDPTFSPGHSPMSDDARYNWSLRLAAPGRIEMTMTITDPVYLEAPWVVENTMLRYDSAESLLLDGSSNDRSMLVAGQQTISAAGSYSVELPDLPDSVPLTAAEMAPLVGRYQAEETGGEISFEAGDDRLWVTMPLLSEDSTRTPLFMESPLRAVGIVEDIFEFNIAADGTATSVTITGADGRSVTYARFAS